MSQGGEQHALAALAEAGTIGEALDRLAAFLVPAGVPPARADARDLIAALFDQPRFWPSANQAQPIPDADRARLADAAERRRRGMPMQYAVRRAAFRHLSLEVDEGVLIPRPETEILVDIVLSAQRGGAGTVVDVGTGSGAIALALASEGKFDRVYGVDLSSDALTIATRNLARLPEPARSRVTLLQGSLLAPVPAGPVEAVVSNPPYIAYPEAVELPAAVRDWEPPLALFADDEGMAVIAALLAPAAARLVPGGLLALEVDSRRAARAAALIREQGSFVHVETRPDLTGRERFVVARREEY